MWYLSQTGAKNIKKKVGNEISCFVYNPLVTSVRSERTSWLWKVETFSRKAKLIKYFDFLQKCFQYDEY